MKSALLAGIVLPVFLSAAEIQPPGERPRPLGVHALAGARVVVKPGVVMEGATILIRNGRIQRVLPKEQPGIPADARVWDLKGKTVYAGFIDPYLSLKEKKARPVSNRWIVPIDARAGINFKGLPTTRVDMGGKGPGYEIAEVRPQYRVADDLSPEADAFEELRGIGFTAGNIIPTDGIIRGSSALTLLGHGDPNRLILKPKTWQHIAFEPAVEYPKSLMGVIAAVRQTVFDTQHYQRMQEWAVQNPGAQRPEYNPALAAMRDSIRVKGKQSVVVETGSVLMIDRMSKLSSELGLKPIMVATGQEWRRPEIYQGINHPFILPVNFPALPELPDEADWGQVSLDQMRHWDWAPEVPALFARHKRSFMFTLHGLGDLKLFRKNIRKAIDRGLPEETALAALTTVVAEQLGVSRDLGTIEPGRLANLVVVDGPSWFQPDHPVTSVWIEGRHYPNDEAHKKTEADSKKPEPVKPPPARVARVPGDYRGPLKTPESVLVINATIWTSGPLGVITNGSMRITNGRIAEIGKEIGVPIPFAGIMIDANGRHVTPGLIDCHSHSMILGGVNEGTLPSTAMVRIQDVVNSETENIYRQLAGGLTTANLLHGSANPIGGQNAVIKLRYGALPDGMIFQKAPPGIKFALGENVKRSNWGNEGRSRFPQTRMGVKTFFNNRFVAARQYLAREQDKPGQPPRRRDLELEALGEILNGDRLVHCHSYRQDEMLVFLRTMERFGVRVATLQHVLEGYKIADEIAAHGVGASSFADWWAYKFEVYDAIPYNGALLHERGAVVSFNSDSSDLARRMNLEAAKAVKYGGTPEAEALNFVTLNPAKQLGIDRWVGSLEVGKDADFVVWNGHPLSTQTLCDETWIEGKQYFDRSKAEARAQAIAAERAALLKKARSNKPDQAAAPSARAAFFLRALEKAHGLNHCYECRKSKP